MRVWKMQRGGDDFFSGHGRREVPLSCPDFLFFLEDCDGYLNCLISYWPPQIAFMKHVGTGWVPQKATNFDMLFWQNCTYFRLIQNGKHFTDF